MHGFAISVICQSLSNLPNLRYGGREDVDPSSYFIDDGKREASSTTAPDGYRIVIGKDRALCCSFPNSSSETTCIWTCQHWICGFAIKSGVLNNEKRDLRQLD